VLEGYTAAGVVRFRGVPYASPPVGQRRWARPEPPVPWPGTRTATRPGPRCPQGVPPPAAPGTVAEEPDPGTAEDCLTLAVTAPAGTGAGAGLPVLVWLHGGGFAAGAGSDYDPRQLAVEGGLVVVTVNYRLGALGFLGLPGLADGGAFGLLDQQEALRWVRRNIAAFGGDPANVTLAGESAGADSVCAHLTSPTAAGLFARAVLQSSGCTAANVLGTVVPWAGPALDTWKPLAMAEDGGRLLAAAVGCPDPGPDPDATLSCLRDRPAADLIAPTVAYWSPATGTPTVPMRPSDAIAAGYAAPVPVLAGTTREEGVGFVADSFRSDPIEPAEFAGMVGWVAGGRTAEVAGAYPLAGRDPLVAWSEVVTDRGFACPNLAAYRAFGSRAPTFAYEFAEPAGAALHAGELPYLFTLTGGQPDLDDEQAALAERMRGSWASFARTGDPGWSRFGADGPVLTLAADDVTPVPASRFAAAHRCHLWP
jgi:para-nitrobenzyl esterase